jgi:hypothetical protein
MESAANLAANQHGAEFDWESVSEMLKRIGGEFDLTITGFPQFEIDNLVKADWSPGKAGEMPQHSQGGKFDTVYLTPEARAALDAVKAAEGTDDDAVAVLRACEHYTAGIPS